jgi:hypothetical protein
MLVLQNCTDSPHILPHSSNKTLATPSDCTCGVGNITVDEEVDVIEERLIAAYQEADVGIKQEVNPQDITFFRYKA